MNADERRMSMDQLTELVIGSSYKVANTLGVGFLEKVYENALVHELRKCRLKVEQQVPLPVYYDNVIVGDYFLDILVEDWLIVELKHAKSLEQVHVAQCLNYLKATRKTLGLLINFGAPQVEVKRVVLNHHNES